jgi:hypothetical protein
MTKGESGRLGRLLSLPTANCKLVTRGEAARVLDIIPP